jgi:hypothetical protein
MAKAISERHEIVVDTDDSTFVLSADSRDGRLVIQQRAKRGGKPGRELCSLSLANPAELEAFFDGLKRLLSSTGLSPGSVERAALSRPRGNRSVPSGNGQRSAGPPEEEREEMVARARGRNPKAFEPWTSQEEEEVRRRFEVGELIEQIARAHNRSPKAIQMRLERLGLPRK